MGEALVSNKNVTTFEVIIFDVTHQREGRATTITVKRDIEKAWVYCTVYVKL